MTGDAIASVDVQGSGLSAIQSVRAIDGLRKRTAGFAVQQWFSSEQSYFAMLDAAERKMRLLATVGDDTLPIDAALGYGGIAVGQDRVIYAARWDKASAGVVVCDLGSKKRWKIGDAGKLYNYLYMSADGSTILVSHLDLSTGKMSTWYGREADNFTLRPVPGIEGVAPGTIRFSPSGNALAFYNEKGLLFQELP